MCETPPKTKEGGTGFDRGTGTATISKERKLGRAMDNKKIWILRKKYTICKYLN